MIAVVAYTIAKVLFALVMLGVTVVVELRGEDND